MPKQTPIFQRSVHAPLFFPTAYGQSPLFEPNFLNVEYIFSLVPNLLRAILDFLASLRPGGIGPYDLTLLKIILWVLAILFAAGIVYSIYAHQKIRREEREKYGELERIAVISRDEAARNERWLKVIELLDSPNEAEWRLAILEADTMLSGILNAMAYHGDTIGDQLKSVDPADFRTLSAAWEAHKVRNRIAHEGSQFILTRREAERIIDLYRQVFEEFNYI